MADIYFFQEDDGDEDQDQGGMQGYGESDSTTNPNDLLPPVEKLEKYADSEHLFNRQVVARRAVLETLRSVVDDPEAVQAVLNVTNKLGDDVEPSVRAELMEQIPHIAMFCQEFKSQLSHVVPLHLLPMVVKFLTNSTNQVRKTSQAALLVLLEQGLVEKSDVEEQVIPVIIRLTGQDSHDDYRTEAVALLSKMAPLIGKEMVESLFLERFASLCVDPLFHVRKVCASNFGEFSTVVGSDITETVLLPKFFYLCEDGVWGVRKACAEVFMSVSCVCSPSVRITELSPIFINLLRDQSRWVRMASFQALGPFISTFADPTITALLHNDNGEIVVTDHIKLADRLDELEAERADQLKKKALLNKAAVILPEPEADAAEAAKKTEDKTGNEESEGAAATEKEDESSKEDASSKEEAMDLTSDEDESGNSSDTSSSQLQASQSDDLSPEERRAQTLVEKKAGDESSTTTNESSSPTSSSTSSSSSSPTTGVSNTEEHFNDFLYWREPLMALDIDDLNDEIAKLDLEDGDNENTYRSGDAGETSESTMELFRPAANAQGSSSTFDPRWDTLGGGSRPGDASPNASRDSADDSNTAEYPPDPALPRGPPATEQEIVPQLLIDHYVSMIDHSRAQTVDSEIARHCAFSLPAVALTLGRSNWPLLRDTYETLASDMQWKVRRTLASSIHELGIILGEDAASTDLIPIFNGFLKDLDEVRIGLLKHLADFLLLLKPQDRQEYLPKLSEFLKMDNERNWRFRQELTEQLDQLIPLFTPSEVEEYLSPIAMFLVRDKVASVRQSATSVIATIINSLNKSENPKLAQNLLQCIVESLARENLWVHRQTFAGLCLTIHDTRAIELEHFAEDLLPCLLDMADDKVPNVRLAVARTLSTMVQSSEEFFKGPKTSSSSTAGGGTSSGEEPEPEEEDEEEKGDKNEELQFAHAHHDRLQTIEKNLKNDSDVDVRSFYGGVGKYFHANDSSCLGDSEDEDYNDVGVSPQ